MVFQWRLGFLKKKKSYPKVHNDLHLAGAGHEYDFDVGAVFI